MTDPVDAHLLAVLAEAGKMAVHELAAKVGMDPRDVAYRLVGLSAQGLPLLVGVESDPAGLRAALAASNTGAPPPPYAQHAAGNHTHGTPSGPYQVHGTPSGAYQVHGTPSGAHAVRGTPSGPHPVQGVPSGAYPVHGVPSGPHAAPGVPSGAYPVHGTPSGPYPAAPQTPGGMEASPFPPPAPQPSQVPPPDPTISTWGVPQSALWARGDHPPASDFGSGSPASASARQGRPGDVLETVGLEGEQLAVQLLEVQDPADYLFSAAGYSLQEGERAVVVHTEITNKGAIPFASLPDNYLELLTADGTAITKAPVSLTSRPPHRIGVQPGETSGGHTVYIVGESVRITAVRWSPRPEPDERSLTWSLDD